MKLLEARNMDDFRSVPVPLSDRKVAQDNLAVQGTKM